MWVGQPPSLPVVLALADVWPKGVEQVVVVKESGACWLAGWLPTFLLFCPLVRRFLLPQAVSGSTWLCGGWAALVLLCLKGKGERLQAKELPPAHRQSMEVRQATHPYHFCPVAPLHTGKC